MVHFTPVACCINSDNKWLVVPAPGDAMVRLSGLLWASSSKPLTVVTGTEGCTCSSNGVNEMLVMGMKFFCQW